MRRSRVFSSAFPHPRDAVLLELDSVTTYRGPAQVLRGISLAVNEDEVVCLVGRNGAGRTTIIESITGLLPIRYDSLSECRHHPAAAAQEGETRHRLRSGGYRRISRADGGRELADQPLALGDR